jgi:hypothetical protein
MKRLLIIPVAMTYLWFSPVILAQEPLQQPQEPAPGAPAGTNWWWLLPLLAIPLLILMLPRRDDRSDYQDSGVAGTKGGQTRRPVDDEDEPVI